MSVELFKSMTYRDNKVFTRQISSNVTPKKYYNEEHPRFTNLYNELGEQGFEKWFVTNCMIFGNVRVLRDSNSVLKKMNYIYDSLWKDEQFIHLYNETDKAFDKVLYAKNDDEKLLANDKYKKTKQDITEYINSFYDFNINKYKSKFIEGYER